jgi:hypothetical protein
MERDVDYLLRLAPELYPEKIEDTGFELSKVIRFYEPENLYEYINGRASLYLSYGFVRLAHGEYRAEERQDRVIVDIYDMGLLRSGFGIYSAERNPGLEFRPLGTQGYYEDAACNFFRGRLYIKMEAEGEGEELTGVLHKLAVRVAELVPGEDRWPEDLSYLPPEHKLNNSEEYIPSSLLGYKFLGDGFSAGYEIGDGDEPARLFVTSRSAPDEARERFARLREAWGGRDMTAVDFLPGADLAFSGQAPYLGEVVIFLAGGRVGGLVGKATDRSFRSVLEGLLARIPD